MEGRKKRKKKGRKEKKEKRNDFITCLAHCRELLKNQKPVKALLIYPAQLAGVWRLLVCHEAAGTADVSFQCRENVGL